MKQSQVQKAAFSAIVNQIIAAGKAQQPRITAKELATRAGITPETLSRMKNRGSGDYSVIDAMARIVGLRLSLEPNDDTQAAIRKGEFF
ncbi:MAG: helix-turn-helix domain-containing protein [Gammaproteobacteria bacterium]